MTTVVWRLYVVRAGDGTLYTGIATDVERRLAEHEAGTARAARYLRGRGPLVLELDVPIGDRARAQQVEHRVKRLSRPRKEALIAAGPDPGRLLSLVEEA